MRFIDLTILSAQYHFTKTAAVIIEPIQGDAGCAPSIEFIQNLRNRCDEVGAMSFLMRFSLGLEEQVNYFFEYFNVVPDILTIGKAFGGNAHGGFVSSRTNMEQLTHSPVGTHYNIWRTSRMLCCCIG